VNPRPESPSLRALERTLKRGGKRAFASQWERLTRRGFPLTEKLPGDRENLLVTFVWRPGVPVRGPSVSSSVVNFLENQTELFPLAGTGVWYRSLRLPRRTRASYSFSPRPAPKLTDPEAAWARYARSSRPDPFNTDHLAFPKDPKDPKDFAMTVSVFELPGAPRQPWARVRGAALWKEAQFRLRSRRLGLERPVWVYVPRDFRPKSRSYNLVVVFDGIVFRSTVPTPTIVERLTDAGRIGPTVLVLVGNAPHSRTKELGLNPRFVDYLARELLPWLRRRFKVTVAGSKTVVCGSSLGGLAAAYAALRYPRLFGNVLAMSGSFQWVRPADPGGPGSLIREYAHAPRLPLRFYLDVGRRETMVFPESGMSLRGAVRHMRDVLEAKGYPVKCVEFEGGHDYACWRGSIADGLIHLLGR
jgi:enterochelin esterase-like enzyme